MELSATEKLFYMYILDRCNNCGVWEVNFKLADSSSSPTVPASKTLPEVKSSTLKVLAVPPSLISTAPVVVISTSDALPWMFTPVCPSKFNAAAAASIVNAPESWPLEISEVSQTRTYTYNLNEMIIFPDFTNPYIFLSSNGKLNISELFS